MTPGGYSYLTALAVFLPLVGPASGNDPIAQDPAVRRLPGTLAAEPISMPTGRFVDQNDVRSDLRIGRSWTLRPRPAEPNSFVPIVTETPPDISKLMRPRFNFGAEWLPETGGLAMRSYDARVTVPTFPVFGPPPPMITAGFSITDLHAPTSLDLPSNLYDVSLGITGMRKLNDRWMFRWMVSSAFASDWESTSSDAWQFRGGAFALWQCNEAWQVTLGALVTGRNDIPVLPAVGAIWQPSERVRVDLLMPQPRVSFMLADLGSRQHWVYAGGGLDGGTWAYQRASGLDETLTYREWRLVLGWESRPPGGLIGPLAPGLRLGAEIGYVLGRTFEFDSDVPDLTPDDGLLLRANVKF